MGIFAVHFRERARLEPEQLLDLVPDHDREADARRDHGDQREPEPEPCEAALPGAILTHPPLDPLASVVALDRGWIEQVLLDVLSLGQGHAQSLEGLGAGAPRLRHTWPGAKMAVARESTGVSGLDGALAEIVARTAEVAEADVVVARLADDSGGVAARAVHATSAALRAELEGSRLGPGALSDEERDELLQLPRPLRRVAEQLGAGGVLQLPVFDRELVIGSLELLRRRGDFDERERRFARAAADEIALARRAFGNGDGTARVAPDLLGLAGDALAAGSDESRAAEQVATLAAEATGARACLVWRYEPQGPVLAALSGRALPALALEAVQQAKGAPRSLAMERVELPDELVATLVTLQLGEPPQGALQLLLDEEPADGDPLLDRLGTFAVRAAHALRAGERRQILDQLKSFDHELRR